MFGRFQVAIVDEAVARGTLTCIVQFWESVGEIPGYPERAEKYLCLLSTAPVLADSKDNIRSSLETENWSALFPWVPGFVCLLVCF